MVKFIQLISLFELRLQMLERRLKARYSEYDIIIYKRDQDVVIEFSSNMSLNKIMEMRDIIRTLFTDRELEYFQF